MAFGIADTLSDANLMALGASSHDRRLLVGGSGLAIGLAALHGLAPNPQASQLPSATGHRAAVSGSCSATTIERVAAFLAAGGEGFKVEPLRIAAGPRRSLVLSRPATSAPRDEVGAGGDAVRVARPRAALPPAAFAGQHAQVSAQLFTAFLYR